MVEIFSYPFMQMALIAGVLVGFLGSYYGVFIVQRQMSFMGSGLAHAAFGGVALGILLNTEPLWIAVPFTILVSLSITWLKAKTKLGADTAIGILFSLSVALGVIFLSLKQSYTADAFAYLFGSIIAVQSVDLIITAFVAVATFLTFPRLWGKWAYATFDDELARTDKLKVTLDDYLLSVMISLSIVVSVKLVGIVLIAAFLVIPPAMARLVASTFCKMTIWSIVFGITSSFIGLWASFVFDIPSGATIIIVQAIFFAFALALVRFQQRANI